MWKAGEPRNRFCENIGIHITLLEDGLKHLIGLSDGQDLLEEGDDVGGERGCRDVWYIGSKQGGGNGKIHHDEDIAQKIACLGEGAENLRVPCGICVEIFGDIILSEMGIAVEDLAEVGDLGVGVEEFRRIARREEVDAAFHTRMKESFFYT